MKKSMTQIKRKSVFPALSVGLLAATAMSLGACSGDSLSPLSHVGQHQTDASSPIQSSLFVQVVHMEVYGEKITVDSVDASGLSLNELDRKYFDLEHATGVLQFDLQNALPNADAESIAEYAWEVLFDGQSVEEPKPCGYHLIGTINREVLSRDQEGAVTGFEIVGSGDGGVNSCDGTGGPGLWRSDLRVTIDKQTGTGELFFFSGVE